MDPHISDIFLQAAEVARTAERRPQQKPVNISVPAPTCLDVLNGRGPGVQRHPGNANYRKLVALNKGLYAKCPRADKAKISKGIVAAIREFGGRFLELDERSGAYFDVGDKRAWDKTSQALREGQKKIRQKLRGETAPDNYDTALLASLANHHRPGGIPQEGYSGYSIQILESLYMQNGRGSSTKTKANDEGSQLPYLDTPDGSFNSQTSPRSEVVFPQTPQRRDVSPSLSLDSEFYSQTPQSGDFSRSVSLDSEISYLVQRASF